MSKLNICYQWSGCRWPVFHIYKQSCVLNAAFLDHDMSLNTKVNAQEDWMCLHQHDISQCGECSYSSYMILLGNLWKKGTKFSCSAFFYDIPANSGMICPFLLFALKGSDSEHDQDIDRCELTPHILHRRIQQSNPSAAFQPPHSSKEGTHFNSALNRKIKCCLQDN